MSKLDKELEEFMRSIRKGNFRQNEPDITKETPKPEKEREKSDASDAFESNSNDLLEDRRPVEKPDPYEVEVDKINERIKQAKALTPEDMREIENMLAQQDIQKDIFRSRMQMRSDEAKIQQEYHSASEDRSRAEAERTAKEKFISAFTKKRDRGRGR